MSIIKKIKLIKFPDYVDYLTAWRYQKALQEYVNEDRKLKASINNNSQNNNVSVGYLLLLQHQSIYTLGKGGNISNLRKDSNGKLPYTYRVERGGDVTWHGPGQITIYPIIDLSCFKHDLHWYLRELEEIVISTLASISLSNESDVSDKRLVGGLKGVRSSVNTGVWIENNKIGAIGITASRWITMHGCSINIDCNLNHFESIVPCGIADSNYGVTSIQNELNKSLITKFSNTKVNGSGSDNIKSIETSTISSSSLSESIINHIVHTPSLIEKISNLYLHSFSNQFIVEVVESDVSELDFILDKYPDIKSAKLSPLIL